MNPNNGQTQYVLEICSKALIDGIVVSMAGKADIPQKKSSVDQAVAEVATIVDSVRGNRAGPVSLTWRDLQLILAGCLRRAADIAEKETT
jgi:hypothetical protein